jgi:hypothetical protein
MPSTTKRSSFLIACRRREALARAAERDARRRTLRDLAIVAALTVPTIAALAGTDIPSDVVVRPEHISVIPAPGNEVEVATIAVTDMAPIAAETTHAHPAPSSVHRTAVQHGGSNHSKWVAPGCSHVADLVRQNGLPAWMTTVAWRESRCRHEVTNFDTRTADRSYGLFQINVLGNLWEESRGRCGLKRPEELLDPHVNVSCAAALYRAYGYQPWDSGRYFGR